MHPFIPVLLWSAIGFSAYYFLSLNHQLGLRIWRKQAHMHPGIKIVVMQRLWGVLFLGIVSLIILLFVIRGDAKAYGLGFAFAAPPPWWTWVLFPVIVLLAWKQAPAKSNLELYPQIRIRVWSRGTVLLSALSWIAFLLAYEFMFRGFLLYGSLSILEPWQAIALNVALYALAHMYKGPGETFGAIPVGILLCWLTLETGNIWMAVLIHCTMALSNEWFSLRAHPDMQLKKSEK